MSEDKIIERAADPCFSRPEGAALTSPGAVRDYLRLALGGREHEVFVCIWVDAQHRVIDVEEAFRGTLTQTSVYPPGDRKGGAAAQRRGGLVRPQPPERGGATQSVPSGRRRCRRWRRASEIGARA